MGKFDTIFDSDDTTEVILSSEEAVGAIAVLAALVNDADLEAEILEEMLWEADFFADYAEDDLSNLVEKLTGIARIDGLGALFNAAYESLSDDLILDAFATAAIVLIENGKMPDQPMRFLIELKEALGLEDEEAEEVIDEVMVTFGEEEEEDFEGKKESKKWDFRKQA